MLCSPGFHSSKVHYLTDAAKRAVEVEYGLTGSGSALTIDHIVPLELGGSNNVASLYPQCALAIRLSVTREARPFGQAQ